MKSNEMRQSSHNKKNSQYWDVPRVVFTYVTARVFYDILMALWRGPGMFLLCICVGALLVSML